MYDSPEVAAEHINRKRSADAALSCSMARYYNPAVGRFASEDSVRFFEGANFYRYVQNRPILFRDPSGHKAYMCTRKAQGRLFESVDANHGYIWTDSGQCCDKAGGVKLATAPCAEGGPSVDTCYPIPDSDGREWELLSCCWNEAMDEHSYIPLIYDCINFAEDCVKRKGFKWPSAPGGRFGPPCDKCPQPPPAKPPDIPPGPPCRGDARLC
jgi:RHS repeat-associated protein